jgi:hypothetical protein
MTHQYVHINYIPEDGWVLSIMSSLLNSSDPRLREAFEKWSGTPLKELGFAITTKIHMLGLAIKRLNARVAELRKQIGANPEVLDSCLAENSAIALADNHFAYELLLDMDSFIFETRSLYEIVVKFLSNLFEIVFGRKVSREELTLTCPPFLVHG